MNKRKRNKKDFSEFKNWCYFGQIFIPCFWCNKDLTRPIATVDHLVSQEMCGNDSNKNLVIACLACQDERGQISTLHSECRRIENISFKEKEFTLLRLKERILKIKPIFDKYKDLYLQLLSNDKEILDKCLQEINDLLNLLKQL